MARFYIDCKLDINFQLGLPDNVISHLNALRIRETDTITLFNGDGYDYPASLIEFKRRNVSVKINQKIKLSNETRLKITLMMALIANERFDLVIQKAVELGVNRIIPLYCQNTQRFKPDKIDNKMKHWQNIIIAASEQSGRGILAKLEAPLEFNDAVKKADAGIKVILSPHHDDKDKMNTPDQVTNATIIIGPEGGLKTEEVSLAKAYGFSSVQLGTRILRAETAAIAGISLLQNHFGDFNFSI